MHFEFQSDLLESVTESPTACSYTLEQNVASVLITEINILLEVACTLMTDINILKLLLTLCYYDGFVYH